MIKIRLARFGKKNDPFYRVVAIDEQKKRDGKFLEKLGYWHPREKKVELKTKVIQSWVVKGAQISPAVAKLLKKNEKSS
jgi:small subunit ribosomal protein S16